MSMERIRRYYGVPAKRGMNVKFFDIKWELLKDGKITSATSDKLFIDGCGPYHPTYGMVYLDSEGNILLDTRSYP